MSINELETTKGVGNSALNGRFRGKDLGSINSLNDYIAFRQAHGIDTKEYKDIYLGDYFFINDGTYNVRWMVAHFDYYWNRGYPDLNPRGIVLIAKFDCGTSKMNNQKTTQGGYMSSIAYTVTCPAIAAALQTVLGSYLLSASKIVSNSVNNSLSSMAGAGWMGASNNWQWVTNQCVLPNEVQIYGTTSCSSSFYDVGEACHKLAVFNFINFSEYSNRNVWLRGVVNETDFTMYASYGYAYSNNANNEYLVRPLIYIG